MQLGGSHDHPIVLHIRGGVAFGNDFDVAGVSQSKQHDHLASQSSGAGAGKVTFNPFSMAKKTGRSSPAVVHGGDEKLHGADVMGQPTDN